jgi:hypothetical protein
MRIRAGALALEMRLASKAIALLGALVVLVLQTLVVAAPTPDERGDGRGTVTVPLTRWRALDDELRAAPQKARDAPLLWVARRVEGRFHKGLWTGRLVAQFEVRVEGPVRVPVIDARAVLGDVTLDKKPASLLEDGAFYSLPTDRPGRHELAVDFHWGRETQRFTRTLHMGFPEGGPIAIEARIAEIGITPSLGSGAVASAVQQGSDTVIVGHLDGTGELRLSWKVRDPDEARGEAKIDAREHTLFHVTDALVTGRSSITIHVVEGESDALDLALPKGVEVLRVEGDAVLQWHTVPAAGEGRGLVVLLRRLVADATEIRVDFQLSSEPGSPVVLAMPMPSAGAAGSIGVTGPPGLKLDVKHAEGVESLATRDLPQELASLARGPVLFGYRIAGAPRVVLAASPLPELELARTTVDELSASTVLQEDGTERTKIALRIRNDGRQYVELALPAGARPMRSFIDGREVRPALLGQRLLLPLRQSERLGEDQPRIHVVRPGETLSDLANLYYSDPSAWQRILAKNRAIIDPNGALTRDMRLEIPPATEAEAEAFFVIEVAYERAQPALDEIGITTLRLPGLDVDTTKAVWHVYLPGSYEPLTFGGNLAQSSRIKYDLLRRLKWFLKEALAPTSAFAGDEYKSILKKRRAIYNDEATREGESFAALTTFPLVGERYKFRRILLGREVAEIRVWYASSAVLSAGRLAALGLVFAAALIALRKNARAPWIALGALLIALLVAAHFIPGLHRRIVWGLDFALLAALAARARPRAARLGRAIARAPWLLLRMVTLRRLLALAGFTWMLAELVRRPMLLSLAALVLLSIVWIRAAASDEDRRPYHAY